MRYDRMTKLIEDEFDRVRELRETKGREYAGEEDTLADFKEVAEETGTTPLQVWATYVKKHLRAIDTFIREGEVRSESIESRIRDVVVYHLLLLGLIEDLVTGPLVDEADADAGPSFPLDSEVVRIADRMGSDLQDSRGLTPRERALWEEGYLDGRLGVTRERV